MLTKSQKQTLAALVRQNQGLLFAKFGPGVTRKRKEEIWEAIRQKLISMGAELPDVRYVRDFEWGNLKRAATKRCAENRMTELDQIVMDTVNGVNASADINAESIEVTPTIFSDFDNNDLTTSESNSEMAKMEQFDGSKFRFDDSGLSNGHLQEDAFGVGGAYGGDFPLFPDPELRLLQKQKLQLEAENLRLQMHELREKSRREKEKFRLETEKMKHELVVLKLKAKEVKTRTDYYVTAQKSAQEKAAVVVDDVAREPHQNGHHNTAAAAALKIEYEPEFSAAGGLAQEN